MRYGRAKSHEQLKIEVKFPLSADRKSYAASTDTTTDDLEWQHHLHHVPSGQLCCLLRYGVHKVFGSLPPATLTF